MAFSIDGLNPIGGNSRAGTAPAMWTYTTTDNTAAMNTAGYFNTASDLLKVGDIMFLYDSDAPTMVISIVLSNASGVVDVSDGTTIAVTDSD